MPDLIPTILLILFGFSLFVLLGNIAYSWRHKVTVERAVPPRGAFTTISSGRLHYVDCGTGQAILMIHGLGGNLGHFDCGLIDDLARDFRVVAIDRPGSGYSERSPGAPANIRAQARQVAEVIEKLEIDNPLVVGHSLGGAVALALALEKPELVRGLALLAPLSLTPKDSLEIFEDYRINSDLQRWITSWTTAIPRMLRHPEPVRQEVFGPDPMPADYAVRGGGLLALRPGAFYNASRDFMAMGEDMAGMSREYARLAVPVRVLYGKEDRVLDHMHHGEVLVRRYPQIGLKLIEGGHMLPITRTADCAGFIRRAAEAMKDRKFISRASPEVYR
jgi:pimeloyl-ACP methyl ester carboxylesterase